MSDEKTKIEAAHTKAKQQFEEAAQKLSNFQQRAWSETEPLVDYVRSFLADDDFENSQSISNQFSWNVEDFQKVIATKRVELDEKRDEEAREYYKKINS